MSDQTEHIALVVEDEADLANIFSEALQAAGLTTYIAYDGRQALEQINSLSPHIIVLDMHLPHVNGLQLLHQIRTIPRLQTTSIIVTSADPMMAEMAASDTDLVLIKPVSFTQLRNLAQRLLSKSDNGAPAGV